MTRCLWLLNVIRRHVADCNMPLMCTFIIPLPSLPPSSVSPSLHNSPPLPSSPTHFCPSCLRFDSLWPCQRPAHSEWCQPGGPTHTVSLKHAGVQADANVYLHIWTKIFLHKPFFKNFCFYMMMIMLSSTFLFLSSWMWNRRKQAKQMSTQHFVWSIWLGCNLLESVSGLLCMITVETKNSHLCCDGNNVNRLTDPGLSLTTVFLFC